MNSEDKLSTLQSQILADAVANCKQALIRNSVINAGAVTLSGPHSARFLGKEHEGWKKPLSKKYVFQPAN